MANITFGDWLTGRRTARAGGRNLRRRPPRFPSRLCLEELENRLAPATVSIADSSVLEPTPHGTVAMDFTVTRTGDLSAPLSVTYTTVAGTAQPNTDFTPTSGTATFAAGSATTVIAIPVFGNGVYNYPNLTFSVQLTGIVGTANSVSFANQVDVAAGTEPDSVASGDLNGDGKPDLVVANEYSSSITVLMNTTPSGATTPSFAPPETFAVGQHPRSVMLADINDDGRLDIVVANYYDDTLSVLMNTTPPGAPLASFAPQQTFSTGSPGTGVGPIFVAVGDLNGDGKPDLIVAQNIGTVSVLMNTTPPGAAIASFTPQQDFDGVGEAYSVAVGDLNGDGRPDIIVTNGYGAPGNGVLSVLMNTTPRGAFTPSFAAPQVIPAGAYPFSVAVGDLNGDGRPDLVVGYEPSEDVSVLLNTTPPGALFASFAAELPLSTATGPSSVAVGDLNGDGRPDIAVANYGNATVSVLLNMTSSGAPLASFATQQQLSTGAEPEAVALGDINDDGVPDLVTANFGAGTVSVLLNTTPSIARNTATGTIIESDPRNDVVVNGTPGNDSLTVEETPGGGIGVLTYVLNGGQPITLTGVTSFTFNGEAGNDTMTVDLANGSPLIQGPGPITFDGGGSGSNTLIVDAAGLATQTVPGSLTVAGPQVVTYANVASITLANTAAVDAFGGPDTADRSSAFAGLTADEHLVQALYLDELGRAGARPELDYWATSLADGARTQANIAVAIAYSPEARDDIVQSWYVSFLGRQPSPGEDQFWVNALEVGESEEDVLSAILASPEFYNRAQTLPLSGSADERYVQALYQLLLARTPGASEVTFWVDRLAQLGPQAVALAFLKSGEFRTDQVEGYYAALLHRPADSGGLSSWALSPLDLIGIRVGIESSGEFFSDG